MEETQMKILSTKKFSEAVKGYREENSLSIKELEILTGVNRNIIEQIEKGEFIPTIVQYECLARILNLNIDALTEDKNTFNSFAQLCNQVQTPAEKKGLENIFQMMIALRQQIRLREAFSKESS